MIDTGFQVQEKNLEMHGITNVKRIYWNLSPAQLIEQSVIRGEGKLADLGPLVVLTGKHTGRSPKDKYVVREPSSMDHVWWGNVNQPYEEEKFGKLLDKYLGYLQQRELFVQDLFAGADSKHRIAIRVITDTAWQNLFAQNMFLRPAEEELLNYQPEWTILGIPSFHTNPALDGVRSEVSIMLHPGKKLVLIAGSEYGGEIKKSVFTILNYVMPLRNVLSMHCSANIGKNGDSALFFGLSGTGKTTLSADPNRGLIGDDQHGWSDDGIFNFEGGCYAKVIHLSPEAEPDIFQTTRRFGTLLENVVMDPDTRIVDLDDGSITENTRASYPLTQIANYVASGKGDHPKNIVFLTADAFGVMPPISKLTPAQAMYHFLLGYTAKVAGTEKGITEPQATFSTCFGAPFMVHHPTVYAKMLGEKIAKYNVKIWLVNTGWTGGPYGVGSRMKIAYTRKMLSAVLNGSLDDVIYEQDPVFGLHIPTSCPDVPPDVLKPRNTWTDKLAYDAQAKKLAEMFKKSFKAFEEEASQEVRNAGPII